MDLEKETKKYEVGYLVIPLIAEDAVLGELAKVREAIEQHGGRIITEETLRSRPLYYAIDKKISGKKFSFEQAYLGSIRFEILSSSVGEVKNSLSDNENILRFLIISLDESAFLSPRKSMMGDRSVAPDREAVDENAPVPEKQKVSEEQLDREIEGLLSPVV